MSVHLPLADESPSEYLARIGAAGEGIAEISADELVRAGYRFVHCPEPEDPNHYEIHPVAQSRRERERKKRAISRLANPVLLVEPSALPNRPL